MKPATLLALLGLVVTVLASMRRAEAGLPIPPAGEFPQQADSPFGETSSGGGFPQVLY